MSHQRQSATFTFEGFDTPNTTQVPDVIFDELAPLLSEAELRSLLYIVRRTFGFKKRSDAISLSQMVDGIRTKDGKVLDRGTGMSRRGVMKGCAGLLEKGIVCVDKRRSEQGDNDINVYSLKWRDGTGVGHLVPYGREQGALRVGNKVPPQETVKQHTELQESIPISQTPLPISRDLSPLKFKGLQAKKNTDLELVTNEPDAIAAIDPPRETGSFAHVGNILSQRIPSRARPTRPRASAAAPQQDQAAQVTPQRAAHLRAGPAPGTSERQAIRKSLQDCIAALDAWETKLDSCVTRACHAYQRSGLDFATFQQLFTDAKWATRERRQGMAYFFTVLEDYCGLREQPPTLQRDPSSMSTARAPARRRKTIGGPMVRVVPLRQEEP